MTKRRRPKRDKTAWGQRICALMDAVDLDVEVLSERLGANRSTIYHWRKGTRIPSPGIQSDLARQLGVSVAELNGWAA